MPDLGTRMDERTRLRPSLVESACAGCGEGVQLRLDTRTAEGANGSAAAITYADADIAVWECPLCGSANADAFGE
jgi:pyruvate/2-oxoacid:ferredoxin oxidoreductase beta subunit